MTPNGQIANPLDKAANREPFVNECKGQLSSAARQISLGFPALSAIRGNSLGIARACYIRNAGIHAENPWVICRMPVFCRYEAAKLCLI